MKTKFALYGIFISIVLIYFASCEKDSSSDKSNHFTYVDNYPLKMGSIQNQAKLPTNGYTLIVSLYSSEISFNSTDSSFTGIGNMVSFTITSPTSTLAVGIYRFLNGYYYHPFTFWQGQIGLNCNVADLAGNTIRLDSGIINVLHTGPNYELEFNGKAESSLSIDGYYKGPLTFIDIKKKSICKPDLISPQTNAILDNGCYTEWNPQGDPIIWSFEWGSCPGATLYNLFSINRSAQNPNINIYTSNLTYTDTIYGYIASVYNYGWMWNVRAFVNGEWGEWSEAKPFSVEDMCIDEGTGKN